MSAVGTPSKTGHPPFRTPSVAVRPKLSCFWMLTASSSLESASLRVRSPSVLLVGRPSSGFFLLLSLSAVVLAASDAALLFSGDGKPSLGHGQPPPTCQVELSPSLSVLIPKSFKIIQLSAWVCGAVGVLQPISVGLPSEEDAKRIVEERPS